MKFEVFVVGARVIESNQSEWLDLTGLDVQEIEFLWESKKREWGVEQLQVWDTRNIPLDLCICEDFSSLVKFINLCVQYGWEAVDFVYACLGDMGLNEFERIYLGSYESHSDFAQDWFHEEYEVLSSQKIGQYVDFEALARDLEEEGQILTCSHKSVEVFGLPGTFRSSSQFSDPQV